MAESNKAPYQNEVIDDNGLLSNIWQKFFRLIESALDYIGQEQSFTLVNNQVAPANITGLKFDKSFTSAVFVEYIIQREHSSSHNIASGIFNLRYDLYSLNWGLTEIGPIVSASGVSLSITSDGQVQYTSTNESGTVILSRIVFRKREIAAKSSLYSKVG